jgi:hypothetical protein
MGRDFKIIEVHAPEDDSGIRGRRQKPHVATHCGVQTDALDLHWIVNCMLVSHQT